jgi:hypothetical protein
MSQRSMIEPLRKLISIHGAAQVAVWLNYRDSRQVNQWVSSETIPKCRVEKVKALLSEKLKKGKQ